MKFFASLGRESSSNRRLNLIGIAVIFMTIAAAGLTIWDLRREAIKAYTQQIQNLGVAFAEQTSRNLQAVDLVLDQANERILGEMPVEREEFLAVVRFMPQDDQRSVVQRSGIIRDDVDHAIQRRAERSARLNK